MTEHERTGHRPLGFSGYQRGLISPGRRLRDVTRHIDADWIWLCDGCKYIVAVIEEKFRPTSPPERVLLSECEFTRSLAEQANTAALAIAWTNAAGDWNKPPDEFVVRVWTGGRERTLVDMDVERILVRLFEMHWDACPRRPF